MKKLPLIFTAAFLNSCSWNDQGTDLNEFYKEAAQRSYTERNPIIVIPGILGSKLLEQNSGTVVWGAFVREAAQPNKPEQARMIALPMQRGTSLVSLRDTTIQNGALDRVKIAVFPGFSVEPKAYLQILLTLGAGGYTDQTLGESGNIDYGSDHYTCFQFGYDWRRSCAENAALLDEFVQSRKRFVEENNLKRFGKRGDVKFDIVAHSMGGLVTRYFLRYGDQGMPASGQPTLNWSGARDVEKVILIGSPSAGSVASINQLTNGLSVLPLRPKYTPALLGTMPSIYELLPRTRHNVLKDEESGKYLDILDHDLWVQKQWGLANSKDEQSLAMLMPEVVTPEERRVIALDHLKKCLDNARRFHVALDRPAKKPKGLKLVLYAGDAVETATVALARPFETKTGELAPGDGTVARYSALMDERFGSRSKAEKFSTPVEWDDVNFLSESHIGLTKSPAFSDNVLFELLEQASD